MIIAEQHDTLECRGCQFRTIRDTDAHDEETVMDCGW